MLSGFMSQALAGQGRVALVTGEAGSGKTALLEEFARQAMAAQGDLLVALGRCSAHGGAGDAYQPFREIMRMLTGDPEGVLSPLHARRLQAALPLTLEALVRHGPDLTRLLGPDPELLARARALKPGLGQASAQRGAPWLARLEALAARSTAPGARPAAGCCSASRRRGCCAPWPSASPVLLLLDDLQWADAPSLDFLFYLGRHLQGSPHS